MEQQNRKSMNFEEMVQRRVNAKAKLGLRSSTMVQDSDIRCSWGHYPSHNTSSNLQIQGTTAKKPRIEESKPKEAKLING